MCSFLFVRQFLGSLRQFLGRLRQFSGSRRQFLDTSWTKNRGQLLDNIRGQVLGNSWAIIGQFSPALLAQPALRVCAVSYTHLTLPTICSV
eukprot:8145045-Alexandrium_andersonii.AAC.1